MQKSELIGAFKIGSQKGHSIDEIKQSLINAGYSIRDVEDSANAFLQGRAIPEAKPLPKIPSLIPEPELKETLQKAETPARKMPLYFWITLVASGIIFLCLIAYILYRIFA